MNKKGLQWFLNKIPNNYWVPSVQFCFPVLFRRGPFKGQIGSFKKPSFKLSCFQKNSTRA